MPLLCCGVPDALRGTAGYFRFLRPNAYELRHGGNGSAFVSPAVLRNASSGRARNLH